jgi:hypothetical protein
MMRSTKRDLRGPNEPIFPHFALLYEGYRTDIWGLHLNK